MFTKWSNWGLGIYLGLFNAIILNCTDSASTNIQTANISVFLIQVKYKKRKFSWSSWTDDVTLDYSPSQVHPFLSKNTNQKKLTSIFISEILELTNVSDEFYPRNYNVSDTKMTTYSDFNGHTYPEWMKELERRWCLIVFHMWKLGSQMVTVEFWTE